MLSPHNCHICFCLPGCTYIIYKLWNSVASFLYPPCPAIPHSTVTVRCFGSLVHRQQSTDQPGDRPQTHQLRTQSRPRHTRRQGVSSRRPPRTAWESLTRPPTGIYQSSGGRGGVVAPDCLGVSDALPDRDIPLVGGGVAAPEPRHTSRQGGGGSRQCPGLPGRRKRSGSPAEVGYSLGCPENCSRCTES